MFFQKLFQTIAFPPRNAPSVTPAEDTVLQALEQARAGYTNAQEVIRFVDGKSNVLIGLSTLASGFLIALIKWSLDAPADSLRNFERLVEIFPYETWGIYAAVVVSLLSSVFCLGAAVCSVIARVRPCELKNEITVLFPAHGKRRERAAQAFFEKRMAGMTKAEILQEYQDQLRVVGLILWRKLKHNRYASIALVVQVIGIATAVLLMCFVYLVRQ